MSKCYKKSILWPDIFETFLLLHYRIFWALKKMHFVSSGGRWEFTDYHHCDFIVVTISGQRQRRTNKNVWHRRQKHRRQIEPRQWQQKQPQRRKQQQRQQISPHPISQFNLLEFAFLLFAICYLLFAICYLLLFRWW